MACRRHPQEKLQMNCLQMKYTTGYGPALCEIQTLQLTHLSKTKCGYITFEESEQSQTTTKFQQELTS